jgi:DNA-binding SARP family transcriptional activator
LTEDSSTSRPPFTLTLFGGVDLRGPGDDIDRLIVNAKAMALLACLAVPCTGRFVRRDALVGLLWPELDQTRARTALRKAIHAIRRALGPGAIIARGDEDLALSPDSVWCDVDAFTRSADNGLLAQALDLCRGELMPGFHVSECWEFDRWLEEERSTARERASGAAWAMAQRLEQDQEFSDAAGMARWSVRFSWSDERALRRALVMLDRLGDRAGALKLFEGFAQRVKAELDADPSQETRDLVARLRAPPNTAG